MADKAIYEGKRYLVNTNSKKIHDTEHIDGRCRVKVMKEEFKVYFDTIEEARNYPSPEAPLAKPCGFCMRNHK